MKKSTFVAIAALISFILSGAYALEVNRPELESTGGQTIEFQNYNGPHTVIDSLSAIKAIGSGLGKSVSGSVSSSGTFGSGRYSVIHAVDATQKEKLDADILVIGADATVDHIRNLRYIIASYLTAAYGYSDKDASTIATFVTVYNAVYRGKLDIYNTKYKTVVTKNLTADKCGLSIKWNEWPGNSQIVIPLSDLAGGLSTVDTSVISDKQVVKSMKEEDNKGVDERKNMVDIKEREAETASEKAQTAQKKTAEETKKATDQKQKAETAQKQADKAKEEAAKEPDNKQKQQEAEKKQETATQEKQKADEQQQKADESAKEAEKQQDIADKKQAEAQAERTEIAKDQQKLLEDALAEAANKNAVIGLKVTDSKSDMSGMVKVDATTGETIRESPVTVIRGRTILAVGNAATTTQTDTKAAQDNKTAATNAEAAPTEMMYMAICGANTSTGTVKLCLLDGNKMEIQKESNEVVADKSVLVQNGSDYYCVIQDGKNWVVGKYDATLKLLLKSPVNVSDDTPITITPNGIVVTSNTGMVLLLKLEDLSSITKIASVPEK